MTAQNPQTAVAVIEQDADQGVVEWNLDAFPEDRYNRLIPTQTIRMPSDLLVPVVQVLKLSLDERDKDVYKSADVPTGHKALTARALMKVATAMGISLYDERRIDDGTEPNVMGVSVMAELLLPTGQKIHAPGSQVIDLRTWFGSSTSDAEKAKFRKQFFAQVSTRARSRAIRAIASLKASYTEAELARPFAVVSFAPNMNHPAVRERMLDVMVGASSALYGSTPAGQIGGGQPVTLLPEVSDDTTEGHARDVTPAAAAQTEPDEAMPSWSAPAGASATDLFTVIRDSAASSGMNGDATDAQKTAVNEIFARLGKWRAGIVLIWADIDVDAFTLSGAQAQALMNVAASRGDAFVDEWHAAVESAAAA